MNKFKNYLFSAVCCMALLLITASINVGQAVGAQGPQNVNVINTPLPVKEVANPAFQPFQAQGAAAVGADEGSANFVLTTVPAGKRLVIEYGEAEGWFADGTKMTAIIATTVGGVTIYHKLVMFDQGIQSGSLTFVAAQPMRLYADPGTTVNGIVSRGDGYPPGGGGWGVTISGYFVDIPLP